MQHQFDMVLLPVNTSGLWICSLFEISRNSRPPATTCFSFSCYCCLAAYLVVSEICIILCTDWLIWFCCYGCSISETIMPPKTKELRVFRIFVFSSPQTKLIHQPWGRYHQEQSSQLITLKSQIFPVKSSNLQSSGLVVLVAKSSVFKTRQF